MKEKHHLISYQLDGSSSPPPWPSWCPGTLCCHTRLMAQESLLIIVVDDDFDTREVVSDVLIAGGYAVITWSSVAGAHHRIRDEQPNLVILDLQMPGDLQAGM